MLELVQCLKYSPFKKGDFIYRHSDYGDRYYMIMRGRISVMMTDEQIKQQEIDADTQKDAVESNEIENGVTLDMTKEDRK